MPNRKSKHVNVYLNVSKTCHNSITTNTHIGRPACETGVEVAPQLVAVLKVCHTLVPAPVKNEECLHQGKLAANVFTTQDIFWLCMQDPNATAASEATRYKYCGCQQISEMEENDACLSENRGEES